MADRKIVSFDWAIKNILRDKANFDILEGFLQALLKEKITINELIESESNKPNDLMKYNRVDILALNSKGEHIIVEVQYAPEQFFFKRLLFATSKDIVDNIKAGEDYSHIKKVYSVSIVYFDLEIRDGDEERIDYVYHGKLEFTGFHNNKRAELDTNCLIGYHELSHENENVFPEYFIIPVTVFNDNINDDLDQWIYALKNNEVKDEFQAPGIKAMREKLEFISMPPDKQKQYNQYLMDLASERDVMQFNEKIARHKGIKEGIEKGIKQGVLQGIELTAINMLKQNIDVKTVVQCTSLTLERVEQLKESL
jgi:predicted transposase/invertase (TIGR01784 family)